MYVCEQLPGSSSSLIVTTEVIKFWKVKVGGGGMCSTERPSSFMLWYILLWMHACFCCACFCFQYLAKRLAGKNISETTILCQVGRKTLTQSMNLYVWLNASSRPCGSRSFTGWKMQLTDMKSEREVRQTSYGTMTEEQTQIGNCK